MNELSLTEYIQRHAVLLCAGTLSTFAYFYLALITRAGDDPAFYQFSLILVGCALLSFWACRHYIQKNTLVPISLMLLFAVIFRLIGIWGEPFFEDDFYRYLWDGRTLVETGNPYTKPPADFFSDTTLSERFEDILDQINYPNIATVYGPVNQWLFALCYLVAPGEIWPLQTLLAAADIGILLMLLRLANANWVLLYAWSPLMIKEFAFTAHPDVLGVGLLVSALVTAKNQRWVLTGLLLGLAAAAKIFALILVPFVLQFRWRGWCAFVFSAIIVALPFGVASAWLPEGLKAMASDWLFNAPLYFLFSPWVHPAVTKNVLMGLFVIGWGWYLYRHTLGASKDAPFLGSVRADVLFGIFFLCAPVMNAWYLVWLLPFGVLYPSATLWATSVALGLAYASGINLPKSDLDLYEQPVWALALEMGMIGAALVYDLCKRRFTPSDHAHHSVR